MLCNNVILVAILTILRASKLAWSCSLMSCGRLYSWSLGCLKWRLTSWLDVEAGLAAVRNFCISESGDKVLFNRIYNSVKTAGNR